LEDHQLKPAIEALIFSSGHPLSLERLKDIFDEATAGQIEEQVRLLQQEYLERGSGLMLAEVAGGYQLATRPEHFEWIRKFKTVKTTTRLSKPALETLAIVAYKQPITRSEVEAIRGVNIGGIMRNLMERRLVKIVGKKDVPGKPMMYGTTLDFLQYFGLNDLSALPTLKEFQELEAGEEVMEEVPLVVEENSDASSSEDTDEEEALSPEAAEPETLTAAATEENVSG
jgi:segregation and condensation protein B